MSSKTVAVFPIASALSKALEFGKAVSSWRTETDIQKRWLELLNTLHKDFGLFSEQELKSMATYNCNEINAWLKENGFDIQLDFSAPDFGVASIMNVLVKWSKLGTKDKRAIDDQWYPIVFMEDGVDFTSVPGYEHTIAHIPCENGDVVHMCVADRSDLEHLDLLEKVQFLSEGQKNWDYEGLYFPMVSLDQEVDISFFVGMNFDGEETSFRIGQALQQTKFRMNHEGARAESAAAFVMECFCASEPSPPLHIDAPFYVWMTRPGMTVPYFAAFIDKEDWKEPESL